MTDLSNDSEITDLLGRSSEIENLTPLLVKSELKSMVLSIDAPWGKGKTTFVNLWQKYLSDNNIYSIYIDAWETDYADDPLIVIVAKLHAWIAAEAKRGHTDGPDFAQMNSNQTSQETSKAITNVAKKIVVGATKTLSVKILGSEATNEISGIVSDAAGDVTTNIIDKFYTQEKAIDQFKQGIQAIVEELRKHNQNNLIIFIDELDRCRPTYSIEYLERIKHIFDIDGLFFVLSTNIEQLSHSVKAVYGSDFDSKKYLERFIDLSYELKEPDKTAYIENLCNSDSIIKNFYDKKSENLNLIYPDENIQAVIDTLVMISNYHEISLREIEKLILRLGFVLATFSDDEYSHPPLLVTLLYTKIHKESSSISLSAEDIIRDVCKIDDINPNFPSDFWSFQGWESVIAYLLFYSFYSSASIDHPAAHAVDANDLDATLESYGYPPPEEDLVLTGEDHPEHALIKGNFHDKIEALYKAGPNKDINILKIESSIKLMELITI